MTEPVNPTTQVSARPITWNIWALAAVLPLLFAVLVWQLWSLDPVKYCKLVTQTGVPSGNYCYQLLTQGLAIKGMSIYLLIGTIASFVVIVLVAAVKAVISLSGPGGWGANINSNAKGDEDAR